jgi:hypothetical protein
MTAHVRWPGKTGGVPHLREFCLEFSFVTFLCFKTKKSKEEASLYLCSFLKQKMQRLFVVQWTNTTSNIKPHG